jgi:hypothetical protein
LYVFAFFQMFFLDLLAVPERRAAWSTTQINNFVGRLSGALLAFDTASIAAASTLQFY